MWKEIVNSISNEHYFKDPATKLEIAQVQKELNVELPEELAALFYETNGVYDNWGCPLIWSTSQIIKDNLFYRNYEDYKDLYMPFDNLFFFSDAGNGDLFCYAILKNGTIEKTDIYVWNHEDDSRTWVAASLKHFIQGWITGEISV
ncbi:SMI1/KNR4 family protein [Bacillus alkalicellulosilyticus]|uniref:SMI1/KNR4 family protein n=1 Tax=Alkalihalobacterium alkalicellulosilyticum TaxID=1912214 RepID=UPI0009966605|nr:SMI1/KNR4 family protein [Bacillus alkalicellulosilyticus]